MPKKLDCRFKINKSKKSCLKNKQKNKTKKSTKNKSVKKSIKKTTKKKSVKKTIKNKSKKNKIISDLEKATMKYINYPNKPSSISDLKKATMKYVNNENKIRKNSKKSSKKSVKKSTKKSAKKSTKKTNKEKNKKLDIQNFLKSLDNYVPNSKDENKLTNSDIRKYLNSQDRIKKDTTNYKLFMDGLAPPIWKEEIEKFSYIIS